MELKVIKYNFILQLFLQKFLTNFLIFLDCDSAYASKSALNYHTKCYHNKEKEKNLMKILMDNLDDPNLTNYNQESGG